MVTNQEFINSCSSAFLIFYLTCHLAFMSKNRFHAFLQNFVNSKSPVDLLGKKHYMCVVVFHV